MRIIPFSIFPSAGELAIHAAWDHADKPAVGGDRAAIRNGGDAKTTGEVGPPACGAKRPRLCRDAFVLVRLVGDAYLVRKLCFTYFPWAGGGAKPENPSIQSSLGRFGQKVDSDAEHSHGAKSCH